MVEISFAIAMCFGTWFLTGAWFFYREQQTKGKIFELERDLYLTRKAMWEARDEIDRLNAVADKDRMPS